MEEPESRVDEAEPKTPTTTDSIEGQAPRTGEDAPTVMPEEEAEHPKRSPSPPPGGSGPDAEA